MNLLFTVVFILFSFASSLYADKGDLGHYVARAQPLEEIPPPNIDGVLTDAAWQKALPVSGFVWKDTPDKPASEETVVYIVYDRHHLYVGFRCYDSEPHKIVNRITRRGGDVFYSDVISFFIDPYHDHRTGYKFVSTPGGVKDDNYRYNDSEVDFTWDRLTNKLRVSGTVNPDFAQVEADQLEINLTRFPILWNL